MDLQLQLHLNLPTRVYQEAQIKVHVARCCNTTRAPQSHIHPDLEGSIHESQDSLQSSRSRWLETLLCACHETDSGNIARCNHWKNKERRWNKVSIWGWELHRSIGSSKKSTETIIRWQPCPPLHWTRTGGFPNWAKEGCESVEDDLYECKLLTGAGPLRARPAVMRWQVSTEDNSEEHRNIQIS